MSSSSRKRRLASPASSRAPRPVERKKAQNRAAQRSFRERQQAYIHYLESFANTVKASQEGTSPEDRYNRLVKTHLDLLEDYHRLHDAFIGLRQKLTGIGETALAAAGDASLDVISNAYISRSHGIGISSDDPSGRYNDDQVYMMPLAQPGADWGVAHSSFPAWPDIQDLSESNTTGAASSSSFNPEMSVLSCFLQDPISEGAINLGQDPRHGINLNLDVESRQLSSLPIIESKTLFADKVEAACKKYMTQIQHGPVTEVSAAEVSSDPTQVVNRLASVAIKLIGDHSGLSAFMYGTDFYKCLEQVLRWRLCNTVESRASVLGMFKPTPLQYTSTDHPIIIDFITWPTIRDQLILHRQTLDLDALCRDLTLHTVVEVPERRAAVGVYEFMLREMSKDTPSPSCLDSPNWSYVQLDTDSPYQASVDPAEDLILQELQGRIQTPDPELHERTRISSWQSPTLFNWQSAEVGRQDSPHLGIYQLQKWKLDPDFAWKWPVIDCSGVLSQYNTAPSCLLT
ncbi:hypothetical protein ACJ41O_005631 [Fusarium nematophilum]